MHNNLNLGICLSQLISILNISGNKLAKALNVDPSLISKWKNGRRKISANSNYIELISSYLSDNIINEHQKERIITLLNNYNISIDNNYSGNMNVFIHKLLIAAQQSTISIHNKNTPINNIDNNFFKSLVNPKIINTQNSNTIIEKTDIDDSYLHSQQNPICKYGHSSNFELIIGHKNVIYAGIDLLKTLKKKPSHINEPVIITFFTEIDSFSNFEETFYEWNHTLLEVQKKGWNINKFITLMDNKDRSIKIINEFQMNLKHEGYCLNYLNKHDTLLNFKEFILIPTIGILICHCTENVNKIDIAFLIRDELLLNIMKNVYNNYSIHSSPVISNKYDIEDINLLSEITISEESNGSRFALNHYLNQFIIPLDNSIQYLSSNKEKISKTEISERILFHKRRLQAFNRQIKNFKFYDIWSKKSIENLIKNSGQTLNHINSYDIFFHLQNIINILENNDNYQIGLLNDTNTKNSSDVSYMIKDSHTIFLQNHFQNNNLENDNSQNEICLSITEPTIVNAFNNHFWELWSKISPINKNKKSVISWLKSQLKVLNNS